MNAERERLERIIASASQELKALEARERTEWVSIFEPGAMGDVVTFTKRFNGSRAYRYAAIRTERGWSITGRTTMTNISWRQVLQFVVVDESNPELAKKSLHLATEWVRIVPGYSRQEDAARRAGADHDGPNYEAEMYDEHYPYTDGDM